MNNIQLNNKKLDTSTKNLPIAVILSITDMIFCIIAFLLIFVGTGRFGPGVSSDSVAYIYAAKTIASGEGVRFFAYSAPFIQWPPLFPAILAIANILGISAVAFSRILNALTLSTALFFSVLTLRKTLKNQLIPYIFSIMCILSFPFLKMAFYVWSEPLYILLCSIIVYILFTSKCKEISLKTIILLGIFSALACLARYVGITILAAVAVYLFLNINGWLKKIKCIFVYGIITALPISIFLIRNLVQSETLVGNRPPSNVGLSTNIHRTAKTIADWLFPHLFNSGFSGYYVYCASLLILALFLYLFVSSVKSDRDRGYMLLFLSAYSVFYCLYMIISATKVAFDSLGDRYLIPSFIPIMIIVSIMFDCLLSKLRKPSVGFNSKNGSKPIIIITSFILVLYVSLFLAGGAAETKRNVSQTLESGVPGFTSKEWNNHKLNHDLKLINNSDMIYTNNPASVYFISGRATHYPPMIDNIPIYSFDSFFKESKSYQNQYIVWFGKEISDSFYTPDKLRNYFNLTEIRKNDQYIIYKMEGK